MIILYIEVVLVKHLEAFLMKDFNSKFGFLKGFIQNYKVANDEIIVDYANMSKTKIPYTLENEQNILKEMKSQVDQYAELIGPLEKKRRKSKQHAILGVMSSLLFIIPLFLEAYYIIIPTFFSGFTMYMLEIFLILTLGTSLPMYIMKKPVMEYYIFRTVINDFQKNRLFFKNEALLNNFDRDTSHIFSEVSTKTAEFIAKLPVEKPVFTMENFKKINIDDLNKIIAIIQQESLASKPDLNVDPILQPPEDFYTSYSDSHSNKTLVLRKKRF